MDQVPAVSVVMCAFNAARTIGRSIESVRAQSFTDWELLIVDDASSDDTAEVAKSFLDSRIVVIKSPCNRGPANARNLAVQHSRGALLAILDADDLMEVERLRRQVSAFHRKPLLDVVGGGYTKIDASGVVLSAVTLCPTSHAAIITGLRWGPTMAHGTVMVRRSAFIAAGGYEQGSEPAEDYRLYGQLFRIGAQFGAVASCVLAYRVSTNSLSVVRKDAASRSHAATSAFVRSIYEASQVQRLAESVFREPWRTGREPRLRVAKLFWRMTKVNVHERDWSESLKVFSAAILIILGMPFAALMRRRIGAPPCFARAVPVCEGRAGG